MKNSFSILAAFVCSAWLQSCSQRTTNTSQDGSHSIPTSEKSISDTPTNDLNAKTNLTVKIAQHPLSNTSPEERLNWLEKLGHLPDDANHLDWELARKTSWWGRSIDSTLFWKGRVVWLDKSARHDAEKLGRMFPPVPPGYPPLPEDDGSASSTLGNFTGERRNWSSAETAFWDKFAKTHPRPSEEIENQQWELAKKIYNSRARWKKEVKEIPAWVLASDETQKNRAIEMGFPKEALTEDSLFWAYVIGKRKEYQNLQERVIPNFLSRVYVDTKLITEPLTQEQLNQANQWKIEYLRRLQREGADQSYINAYLKTWNLTPDQIK